MKARRLDLKSGQHRCSKRVVAFRRQRLQRRTAEERIRLGRAGRAKVLREYDWEVKVDRMLQLYRSAIRDGGAR